MARFEGWGRNARDESNSPRTRYDRVVAPDDKFMEPGRPGGHPRAGESPRLYRRA